VRFGAELSSERFSAQRGSSKPFIQLEYTITDTTATITAPRRSESDRLHVLVERRASHGPQHAEVVPRQALRRRQRHARPPLRAAVPRRRPAALSLSACPACPACPAWPFELR